MRYIFSYAFILLVSLVAPLQSLYLKFQPNALVDRLLVAAGKDVNTVWGDKGVGRVEITDELIYQLDGVSYFSPTHVTVATIKMTSIGKPEKLPMAIIPVPYGLISAKVITIIINDYLAADDVLAKGWLSTLLLRPVSGSSTLRADAIRILAGRYGTTRLILPPSISVSSITDPRVSIETYDQTLLNNPIGPYLASANSGRIHPVYRLYPDIYRTFLFGIYPISSTHYAPFRHIDTEGHLQIPVPSRLYHLSVQGEGVRGQRIAVKDLYNIAGVPTAAGSKSYAQVYGAQNETAESIQRLQELGGVLVCKTKTAQFASGASTSDETLDEQYPWSPRADLYQSCGASSSGSACAIAAYDWLDIAIGSDTGGSVRWPAALQGVYGNRPSTGAISLEGVVPLSAYSDTAGIFSRDPQAFISFLRDWTSTSPLNLRSYTETPRKLLVPESYLAQSHPKAQAIVNTFLISLITTLNLIPQYVDLDLALASQGYDAEELKDLNQDWRDVARYHSWTQVGRDFTSRYAGENEGRWPPLDPDARGWWHWAESADPIEMERKTERLERFREWFEGSVVGGHEETCSESIMIYDIGTGGLPTYRERALNERDDAVSAYSNHRNNSLPSSYFCATAGCVDYTIPIGQVPFRSAISGRMETKAVTVSLVAFKGCDLVMMDFVEMLSKKGLIGTVKTGRNAF